MAAAPPPFPGPFPGPFPQAPHPPPARNNIGLIAIAVAIVVVGVLATGAWLVTSAASTSTAAGGPVVHAPAPTSTDTSSTAGTSTTYTAADQQFLGTLARLPDVPAVTNPQSMISGAHSGCTALAQGATPRQLMNSIASGTGLGEVPSGEIVGAAIVAYCPEYRSAAGI